MTVDWGGAQWLLAGYLGFITVGAPALRWGIIYGGGSLPTRNTNSQNAKSWSEYWGIWLSDVINRLILIMILRWGGFW